MSKNVDWITARIAQARKQHPAVTDTVSMQIEGLLRGELAERELSGARLAKIAKTMIADTWPAAPETGTNG